MAPVPPLALDIDGTMTLSDGSVDPRVWEVVRGWDAPVVVATGKAFPYPVALCHFMGVEKNLIAENGGIAFAGGELHELGDGEAARAAAAEFVETGHDLGWGDVDLTNRWRETEVAVDRSAPLDLLREIAARHDLEVVDTGYAYHVKSASMSKGRALETVADVLGLEPAAFVAVGDSENDVSTFGVAGTAYAVANADEKARAAADFVTDDPYSAGLFEALEEVRRVES